MTSCEWRAITDSSAMMSKVMIVSHVIVGFPVHREWRERWRTRRTRDRGRGWRQRSLSKSDSFVIFAWKSSSFLLKSISFCWYIKNGFHRLKWKPKLWWPRTLTQNVNIFPPYAIYAYFSISLSASYFEEEMTQNFVGWNDPFAVQEVFEKRRATYISRRRLRLYRSFLCSRWTWGSVWNSNSIDKNIIFLV